MLLIAVVAIVVIGPKDLPKTLRTVGQWLGAARRVARDFKDSVDDMVRDSELDELRRDTERMSNFTIDEARPVTPPPPPRVAAGPELAEVGSGAAPADVAPASAEPAPVQPAAPARAAEP